MPRTLRMLFLIVPAVLCVGCQGPHAFLVRGTARDVDVSYAAGDLAGATEIARKHCAGYERVPHYLQSEENIASFDCVRP